MNFFKKNLGWKIASLVIGFLLWSYITAGVNPTQEMTMSSIPLQLDNDEELKKENFEIVSFKPETVSVTIRGKRNDLGRLDKRSIRAIVDAKLLKEGSQLLPIHYETTGPVSLSSYSDYYAMLDVEKLISQNKGVQIETKGDLSKGLILEKLTPTPASIEVRGPRTLVESVDHLSCQLDLEHLSDATSQNLPIVAVDDRGDEVKGVNLDITTVNVAVSILKQKEVPIQIHFVGEAPDGVSIQRIQQDPATVLIEGKIDQIDTIEEIETVPVERKDLKEGSQEVDLVFPSGIRDVEDRHSVKFSVTFMKDSSNKKEEVSVKEGP